MARKKKEPIEFASPFSEEFMSTAWEVWRQFKKEQFRFTYKPIGERAAIEDLWEISNGDEQTAKLIIKKAIVKGWRGLFALNANDTAKQQPATKTREDLADVLGGRNYERQKD